MDESEVLTPADNANHIDKAKFRIPFVCGCRDLGEALRRVSEGAAMIRTKVVINSLLISIIRKKRSKFSV